MRLFHMDCRRVFALSHVGLLLRQASSLATTETNTVAAKSSIDLSASVIEPLTAIAQQVETPSFVNRKSNISAKRIVTVHNALCHGCIDYSQGWAWQHLLLQKRLNLKKARPAAANDITQTTSITQDGSDTDALLLLQHSPVYTLGRGADENFLTFLQNFDHKNNNFKSDDLKEARWRLSKSNRGAGSARLEGDRNFTITSKTTAEDLLQHVKKTVSPVLAPNGVPIYRVERGGEVTYHGPGQLVVYPVLDLTQSSHYEQDLHWMLRMMEEVVIQTLKQHYNIQGRRDSINSGVWVGQDKICAVGIAASRWITTHGLAINICPDLDCFDTSIILPCGVQGRGVTSMAQILQARQEPVPTVEEFAENFLQCFRDVFRVDLDMKQIT